MRARAGYSRSVLVMGVILIAFAFLWSILSGSDAPGSGYGMSHSDRRNVIVVSHEGEIVETGVSGLGDVASAKSLGSGSDVAGSNNGKDFSFSRDVLGIYESINWGKILRGAMYALGILFLVLSNVKFKR